MKNHRENYSDTGYFIRSETYYKVENDFPRIEEKDIRSGVGDVKYSIIISQFSEYVKSEEFALQNILFS